MPFFAERYRFYFFPTPKALTAAYPRSTAGNTGSNWLQPTASPEISAMSRSFARSSGVAAETVAFWRHGGPFLAEFR